MIQSFESMKEVVNVLLFQNGMNSLKHWLELSKYYVRRPSMFSSTKRNLVLTLIVVDPTVDKTTRCAKIIDYLKVLKYGFLTLYTQDFSSLRPSRHLGLRMILKTLDGMDYLLA